ncbi:MAG: aminoacyl-tRNA deacylase [Chloroflexota bacterium]
MPDYPMTTAVRELRQKKIDFIPHEYEYEEKGGTAQTARILKVPESSVIKTIVLMDDAGEIFITLMRGDQNVSTKEMARIIGAKKVEPCDPATATRATGYQFGGTSPFGTRKRMKVYCEESALEGEKIYINGGKQGFILEMKTEDLEKALDLNIVNVGIAKHNA